MKQFLLRIFFGLLAIALILSYFVCSPEEISNQQTAETASSGDLSDPEKLAVCAGDFTFLTLTLGNIPRNAGTEDALAIKKLAFWFLSQSSALNGSQKTLEYSSRVVKYFSDRYEREDKKALLLEVMGNTSHCIQLVQRLIPETSRCFALAPNQYTGVALDFKC